MTKVGRDTSRMCAALALALAAAGPMAPAAAQQAPATTAQPPADPAFAAASAAYDGLPEAERKAIQENLIWTGDFAGTGTGGCGPLTYRAIQAFQKRAGVKPDGILQPKERAALAQSAARARDAIRFTRLLDARSGTRIGVPQALLDRTRQAPAGTVFASADGSVTLEMLAPAAELQPLYDLLRADQPGRRITYKVLRPDWFVVAGDGAGKRFYTRMNMTPAGLRGYTLTYPLVRAAEFDRIAIAVANSFESTPSAVAAAPTAPGPSQPQPPATTPMRPADTPTLYSGIVMAPGTLVTVAAVEACPAPTVGKQPVRIAAVDRAAGLAVLDVPGLAAPPAAMRAAIPADADPLLVLEQTPFGRDVQLAVVPAQARLPDAGKPRVFAPLQRGAAGAAVFDRAGALVGLVASVAVEPRVVAGVMPQASWPLVPAAALFAAAKQQPAPAAAASAPLTTGAVAAAQRGRVVAIDCAR